MSPGSIKPSFKPLSNYQTTMSPKTAAPSRLVDTSPSGRHQTAYPLLQFSSMMIKKALTFTLCLILVRTSVVHAGTLSGTLSPEGQAIHLDNAPHSLTKNGQRVYAEFPDQKSFRKGVLKDGAIRWEDGKVTQIQVQNEPSSRTLLPNQNPTAAEIKAHKDSVKRLARGDWGMTVGEAKTLKATGRGLKSATGGTLRIASAMALGALFKLSTQYGTNPRAWTAFLENLEDPYFYGTMGVFGTAFGSVFLARRVTGKLGIFKPEPGFFTSAAALGVGVIGAKAFTNIIFSEYFDTCFGFDQFSKTGSFISNHYACEQMVKSVEMRKLSDDVLGDLVSASMALGILSAGTSAFFWFASKSQILTGLLQRSAMLLSRIPKSNWAISTLNTALLLLIYETINDTFGMGKMIGELQAYKYSFQTNSYGQTLEENGNLLMTSLSELMKDPFKDLKWDEVCVRQSNSTIMSIVEGDFNFGVWPPKFEIGRKHELYNCENPNIQYLPAVIQRYQELQAQWRNLQFSEMIDMNQSYILKTNSYYTSVDLAHKFYYTVLTNLQKERGLKNSHTLVDELFLKDMELNMKLNDVTVDTLLYAMVCGADAGEKKMTQDSRWHDLRFNPPRATIDLPAQNELNVTICNARMEERGSSLRPILLKELRERLNPLFVDGNLEYKGTVEDRFQNWWTENVTGDVIKIDKVYYNRYQKLLKNYYLPILTGTALYKLPFGIVDSCREPQIPSSAIKRNTPVLPGDELKLFKSTYAELGGSEEKQCGPNQILRTYKGIEKSMGEEIRMYLSILAHTYSILRKVPNQPDAEFNRIAKEFMTIHADAFAELRKIGGQSSSKKIASLVPRFQKSISELTEIFDVNARETKARANFVLNPSHTYLAQVSVKTIILLGQVFGELERYTQVLQAYDSTAELELVE